MLRYTKCKRECSLDAFRPSEVEHETKKRMAFDAALEKIRSWDDAAVHPFGAYSSIGGLLLASEFADVRCKTCTGCRLADKASCEKPTTVKGQCRALWYKLREADCVSCGKHAGHAEYDHRPGFVRVHHVSHWSWWASHCGVEKMQEEADKCDPRCAFCHLLQPTHSFYQAPFETWEEMPTETPKQRDAQRHRRVLVEKRTFVNAIKMEKGEC